MNPFERIVRCTSLVWAPIKGSQFSAAARPNNLVHVLISLVIFSLFYWIAAYNKPFHVDEFYSWVYAQRCTFTEILMLKDSGIGHPPLYHLLQKSVQVMFANYHPMQVRLINYIVGTIFIMLLVRILSKEKNVPLFYYGVSSSAGILNAFVFSRMWGLVCLSSLLLLWRGEEHLDNPGWRNVLLILCVFFFGIYSDYNFILLLPYVLIVLFARTRYIKSLIFILPIVFCATWIFSMYRFSLTNLPNIHSVFLYRLIESSCKVSYEMGIALFNFWFHEPYMMALGAVVLSYYWFDMKGKTDTAEGKHGSGILPLMTLIAVILISLEVLIRDDIVRIRQVILLLVLISIMIIWLTKKNRPTPMSSGNVRLVTSILCAMLILLSIDSTNMFSGRDLKEARFMIILLPFILLLIYRNCSRKTVASTSLILFISGLLYVTSYGVSAWYPPPYVKQQSPVIFQDERAYSTQYFYQTANSSDNPFFMDLSKFDKSCRVCKMGISDIPFQNFNKVWVVAWVGFNPGDSLPIGYWQCNTKKTNLTRLDRLQFRYFTPIYPLYFEVSEYCSTLGTEYRSKAP